MKFHNCRIIDPARNKCYFIPIHFRKRRGNGWGTDAVFKSRINSTGKRRRVRDALVALLALGRAHQLSPNPFCS